MAAELKDVNCITEKRAYATEALAHMVRRGTVRTNARNNVIKEGALNVYRCKRCDYYHVGHVRVTSNEEKAPRG